MSAPLYDQAHGLITRYERDVLRERWFAQPDGLLNFAWEAVKTKDEHDGRLKPLPRELYLLDHFQNFLREPIYFVLKSRQILITWSTFIGLVWETLRTRYCKIGLIPKKDEDGEDHIEDRIRMTIWPSLPEWVRDDFDFALTKGAFRLNQRRDVEGRWDSFIVSYARGPDQLRQHTHYRLFWDEMAYQAHARKGWQAAMPTIGSRGKDGPSGRAVAVSTMVPGSWHDQLLGLTDKGDASLVDTAVAIAMGEREPDGKLFKSPGIGICHYRNFKRHAFCAVYSFLADSQKRDPAWERQEAGRLFGGVDAAEWQLDYRMQRNAFRGVMVYPHFDPKWNVVPCRPIDMECELFLSFDFGHTNPTAVLFWEWNETTKTLTAFDEIYVSTMEAGEIKQLIQHKLAERLNLPVEDVVFSELLGHNVGDPSGPSFMLSYAQEPNPLSITGNPVSEAGTAWKINARSVGENRLDSGMRPSFVCCGARQYAADGTTAGACVGMTSESGAPTACGKKHDARPMIVFMEGRTPNLFRELPLQKRIDPGDPSLEATEKSNRNIADHATDSARLACMRYPHFLGIEGPETPIPRYLRLPVAKLTAVEAFWRESHSLVQDAIATQSAIADIEEIGYADAEDGAEDGYTDAY